jgi:hypothetical protein
MNNYVTILCLRCSVAQRCTGVFVHLAFKYVLDLHKPIRSYTMHASCMRCSEVQRCDWCVLALRD